MGSDLNSFAPKYAILEDTFRRHAGEDGTIYLPNPSPSGPVDYVFVAMEPSTSRLGIETMRVWVSQGYRNFLFSIDDFCLHYSIRKYLCGSGTYHVTDLSKGPMFAKQANQDRWMRWERWYGSFLDEIELVAKPGAKILALGGKAETFLKHKGFQRLGGRTLHFSPAANGSRKKAVKGREAEFGHFGASLNIEDVVEVAEAAMAKAFLPDCLRQRIVSRFPRVLSPLQRQLIFTYKVDFEALRSP